MEKTLNLVVADNKDVLLNEIREVCHQIASTNTWFQMEDDEDLIEACIYQMEVLNARYRYLIRKARNEKITLSPFIKREA